MVAVLALASTATTGYAQSCRSDMLADMMAVMHMPAIAAGCDSVYQFTYNGRDVVCRVEDGQVSHIGYALFDNNLRSSGAFSPIVADFVERYWLSLDLPLERQKTVKRQLSEDKFVFVCGSQQSVAQLQAHRELPIFFDFTERQASIAWGEQNHPVCSIKFPINHELILGQKMLETDRRLPAELLSHKPDTSVANSPAPELLVKSDSIEGLYVKHFGGYIIEQLTGDRYFTFADSASQAAPVFTASLPAESIINLFTDTDIKCAKDIKLHLSHQIFGNKRQEIVTDVMTFVDYCLLQGCQPYVGIISLPAEDNPVADVLVVMRNKAVGYNHVLRIKVDMQTISTGAGTLEGRLTAYIPTSNIKNLFKEYQ